jgi:hypothetical protein
VLNELSTGTTLPLIMSIEKCTVYNITRTSPEMQFGFNKIVLKIKTLLRLEISLPDRAVLQTPEV